MRNVMLLVLSFMLVACGGDEDRLGDTLFAKMQYLEAIEAYTTHLQLHPNNIKSIYNRGRCYEELKDFDKAKEAFEATLAADKTNTSAMLSLCMDYYRNAKYDKAKFYAADAIKINVELAEGHYWLGRTNIQLSKFDEALTNLNDAINLSKSNGNAYLLRGVVKLKLKREKEACTDFNTAQNMGVVGADNALKTYCK